MGLGTKTNVLTLTQLNADTDWAYVSCSSYCTYALKTDGTLWGTGLAGYGELGTGVASSTTWIQIGTDNDWVQVCAGLYSSGSWVLGLKRNGTAWGWGVNACGQLAGNSATKLTPTQIGSSNAWVRLAAGGFGPQATSYGLQSDGSLWAWGYDGSGPFGNNTSDLLVHTTPLKIGTTTTWTNLYAAQNWVALLQ